MNKTLKIIGLGLLLILFLIVVASYPSTSQQFHTQSTPTISTPTTTQTKSKSVVKKLWKTIKIFSGEGSKTTNSFKISSAKWRMNWQANDEITVYVNNTNHSMSSCEINAQKAGSDSSYCYEKGTFYLKVFSYKTVWKITIQEYK